MKVRRVDYFPDDFLVGVSGMPLDEIGAYWVTCSLIYSRGGPIPNDDNWIAGILKCNPRTWRAIRDRLMKRSKLRLTPEGMITNGRAETELNRRRTHAESASKAARIRFEREVKGGRNQPERGSNEVPNSPNGLSVPGQNNDLGYAAASGAAFPTASSQQPAAFSHQPSAYSQQPGAAAAGEGVPSPAGAVPLANWHAIGERACDAAGIDPTRIAVDFAVVIGWLKAGHDPDTVIIPAIRSVAARTGYKPARSLGYFSRAIADWAERAAAAPPAAPDCKPESDEWYDRIVVTWLRTGVWSTRAGPSPGERGCRVPHRIFERHGVDPATGQRRAA